MPTQPVPMKLERVGVTDEFTPLGLPDATPSLRFLAPKDVRAVYVMISAVDSLVYVSAVRAEVTPASKPGGSSSAAP